MHIFVIFLMFFSLLHLPLPSDPQPNLVSHTTCQSHLNRPQSSSPSKLCPSVEGHRSHILLYSGGKVQQNSGRKPWSQPQVKPLLGMVLSFQFQLMCFLGFCAAFFSVSHVFLCPSLICFPSIPTPLLAQPCHTCRY